MSILLGYERDHRGRLPIMDDSGHWHWLTDEQHAQIDAREAAENEKRKALSAEIAAIMAADERDPVSKYITLGHPSYGRSQIVTRPDGTTYTRNWPSPTR